MRLTSCAAHGGNLIASFLCAVLLAACGGGSDAPSQSPSNSDTPGARLSLVSAAVDEGADVAAYIGKSTAITVRFSASEGTVTALRLQPPATPGWQSADGKLGCDSVTAAQPCTLRLLYAPKAFAAPATMRLSYSYVDSAGAARSDTLSINYRTLPANTATASLDPAGTVNAVVGVGSSVTVSFATSDGVAASALHIDFGALPAGWSGGASASAFDCASFGGGNACRLRLSYQPSAAVAQTSFDLPYSYLNSAGNARSGKLNIAYAALMPNTVFASVAPSGTAVAAPGTSREVSVTFQPSDGNAASALKLAADVALPAGWSIKSSTLPCDRVDAAGACRLALSFAPATSQPQQQLNLGYDYVNAAGEAQQGVASIAYSSRIYRAYVADYGEGGVRQCEVAADGSLRNCAQAASIGSAAAVRQVLVSGARAYVASGQSFANAARPLSLCDIDADGSLRNCADTGVAESGIAGLALQGQYAYLVSSANAAAGGGNFLKRCTLNDSGGVQAGSCAQVALDAAGALSPAALTAFNFALYVVAVDTANNSASLLRCTLDLFGGVGLQCQPFAIDHPQTTRALAGVTLSGGDYLYLLGANGNAGAIVKCTLSANGSVSGCGAGALPAGFTAEELAEARDISIIGKQAYLAIAGGSRRGILRCAIDEASGDLQSCIPAGDTGAAVPVGVALR